MRISDLQKFLAKVKRKHGDVEVLETRYSDLRLMGDNASWEGETWDVVHAAPQPGGDWLMRDHRSLTDEQRAAMNFQPYLLFKGN